MTFFYSDDRGETMTTLCPSLRKPQLLGQAVVMVGGSFGIAAHSSCFSNSRSIRGSGINQRSATKIYSPLAIQERTNASGMAAR